MSAKRHPTQVEGFVGDVAALAKAIAALRYDVTTELFDRLSIEFEQQATGDQDRGRAQLATRLFSFSQRLRGDKEAISAIFRLCAPYMKEELQP